MPFCSARGTARTPGTGIGRERSSFYAERTVVPAAGSGAAGWANLSLDGPVLPVIRGGLCRGLDGQAGQDAVQPAGQGPVGRADEVHEGGHQQAADEQGVDEDGEAEPEAELRPVPVRRRT